MPSRIINRPCAAVLMLLFMGACATHQWAPGPGLSAGDFEPAKARCSLMARHSGSGFVAYGSPNYVAGAALGHAIGESVRTQQDFNDCMVAGGWRIADGQTTAAQIGAKAQLAQAKDERIACIGAIRTKPDFELLLPHFSDINTGDFTMAQLTDARVPTPAEGHLVSSYVDEANPCVSRSIEATSQVVPASGAILRQAKSSNEATMVLLVQRKLTWGEAAQRQKQAQEEAGTQLRQIRP